MHRFLCGSLLFVLAARGASAVEIAGLVFFDYSHEATEGGASDGMFETGRASLTLADKPADNLAYRLQFDAERAGVDTGDTALEAYVKHACVAWTTDWGKWVFGLQGMNMFPVQENTFGNRFLAKPLMDEYKFSSSADMGLGYYNTLGPVTAGLLCTNGAGYRKPENDKYKKISLSLVAGEANLSKSDGWNAGLVYSTEAFKPGANPAADTENKSVMGLFAGWAGKGLRAGLEFDTKTTTGAVDVVERISGFYGGYTLPVSLPVDLVAQVAMVDPDTDTDDDSSTDLLLGVTFNPAKGLRISPNLRTISHEAAGVDPDIWYRLSFEFRF